MTNFNIYVEVSYTETYRVNAVNELEARNIYLNNDHGNGDPIATSVEDRKLLFIEKAQETNEPQQLELDFNHAKQ